MKKIHYYLLIAGLLMLVSCQKEDLKFEEVVLSEATNEDIFLGGWVGTEEEEFYQDINLGFGNGNLPDRVDLTPYLPPVGDQGWTGTCVAWAAGYYTKTAMNAIDGNIAASDLHNPALQYSPKDLFFALPPNQKGPNCNGTHFYYALNLLLERGVASMQSVPFQNLGNCSQQPQSSWTSEALNNRIENYREIPIEVSAIKEKLAEGRPLVWGAHPSETFAKWRSEQVMTEPYILDGTGGPQSGHAMTIVGYDDALGAFRIVNSWGIGWGDRGFAWVSYPLMVNPAFTQYIFAVYNKYDRNNHNPGGNTSSGIDLLPIEVDDRDDTSTGDQRYRELVFDIKNQGNKAVDNWDAWNNVYLYYNAYNANDMGIILHQRVDTWIGDEGDIGPYEDGIGGWASYWFNAELGGREELADQFFGPGKAFSWKYKSPNISGQYYLALITDAFEEVDESNETNNIFFITGQNGRPINFVNGVGSGFHSGDIDDRQSERDPNAYTPAEIRSFIARLKASGKLKKMVADAQGQMPVGVVE